MNRAELEEALRRCEQNVARTPDDPRAHHAHGNALQALRRLEKAIESYGRAIAFRPDYVQAYSNRGTAYRRLARFDEALDSYARALALLPEHPGLHSNRGNALQDLKRFEEAIESYDQAIALKSDYAEAYNNRGVALKELRRFDEAMADFDRALMLDPDYAEPLLNKSVVHLLRGRLDLGWQGHEARKRRKEPVGNRRYAKPLWLGETDIAGRTILVHWEQGYGDVIQFSRYVRPLEQAGARVLFGPQRELQTLMRGLDAAAHIVDADSDSLLFDCHCPLMSLPLAFQTELGTIPRAPYLAPDEAKITDWRERIGERTRPRIGVVWTGNPLPDKGRSIPLELFARLFDRRFEFFSLQKKVSDQERNVLDAADVLDAGRSFIDFSDTAALCSLMDLVISIDTSVAHLAGALGIPTWVLLPCVPDWRWMLDRDDTPWYPSMRLFRQHAHGEWTPVLRRVEAALRDFTDPVARLR